MAPVGWGKGEKKEIVPPTNTAPRTVSRAAKENESAEATGGFSSEPSVPRLGVEAVTRTANEESCRRRRGAACNLRGTVAAAERIATRVIVRCWASRE